MSLGAGSGLGLHSLAVLALEAKFDLHSVDSGPLTLGI